MLNLFSIDPHWIVPFRSDYLTPFFKFIPNLVSDYFFVAVIAGGYWLGTSKKKYVYLGFLVPFTTLFNCLLKNIFQIPRPEAELHLIHITDSFGFPSGDVQVGIVFWFTLYLYIKNRSWRYLCFLPILLISFSRLYLGVHSVYDVFAALILGYLTVKTFFWLLNKGTIAEWYTGAYSKYWTFLLTLIGVYCLIPASWKWPSIIPTAVGSLIGYGLSLPCITQEIIKEPKRITISSVVTLFVSSLILMVFIAGVKIHVDIHELTLNHGILTIKFILIGLAVYVLIPKIRDMITQQFTRF